MTGVEKAEAERLRAECRNAAKRVKRAAAATASAAEIEADVQTAATVEVAALGRPERLDFEDWLHQRSWLELPLDDANLEEWRMTDVTTSASSATGSPSAVPASWSPMAEGVWWCCRMRS